MSAIPFPVQAAIDMRDAAASIANLVASNRELSEAIRVQAVAINALADAIAAPMEDEPEQASDVERYMDGTPVGE